MIAVNLEALEEAAWDATRGSDVLRDAASEIRYLRRRVIGLEQELVGAANWRAAVVADAAAEFAKVMPPLMVRCTPDGEAEMYVPIAVYQDAVMKAARASAILRASRAPCGHCGGSHDSYGCEADG